MYDNLMKRQITLVDWCCLCRSVGQTGFFCCCTVTLHMHYGPLFSWCLGVQWAISRTVVHLLFGWMNWFGKQSSFVWKLVSLCLLWILSRKESYTYEDLGASVIQLKSLFSFIIVWKDIVLWFLFMYSFHCRFFWFSHNNCNPDLLYSLGYLM